MSSSYKKLILLLIILSFNSRLLAQMSSGDAMLVGDFVEIGISGDGGFEGSDFPLPGMHPRGGAGGIHGFVANPQANNWASYDGDFFTPGTEENGWGLEFPTGINYHSNANREDDIPGTITSYTKDGDCITAVWVGNIQNVEVKIVYKLNVNELFYTTRVILTNNSGADLNNLYYYRNLDPDNNVSLSGDYSTTNTIVNQASGVGCIKSIVSAESFAPWNSYMALGAIGSDFRVTRGGFSNRDASDIWNGLGGLQSAQGSTGNADEAISLAYRINSLPAGDVHSFVFVVVLNESDVDVAISSLFKFENDGVLLDGGTGSVCAVNIDTARLCNAALTSLSLTGEGLDLFNWQWSPATNLSTTNGPSVDIINGTDITYTVTGTPVSPCFSTALVKTIRVEFTGGPLIDWTDPGGICTPDFDLSNLVYQDLNGLAGTQWSWHSAIPADGNDMSNELNSLIVGPDDPVFLMAFDPAFDCFNVVEIDLDFVNLSIKNSWTVDASCNLSDGEVGVEIEGVDLANVIFEWTDSNNIIVGDTSFVKNLPAGEYHLEISSTVGCPPLDIDLEVLTDAITATVTGTDVLCKGECTGTVVSNVSGGAGVYNYSWNAGTAINAPNQNSLCAGVYLLEVSDINGCTQNVAYTISEPDTLISSILEPAEICESACDGVIDLTVTGGVIPYTINWLSSNGDAYNTEDLNGLCGGDYDVEIEDANGCVINNSITITSFNLSIKNSWTVDASCNLDDGEVGVEVEGVDLANVVFEWTDENNIVVGDTSFVKNLPAGVYHLDISTTIGCAPLAIDLEVFKDSITAIVTGTNASCNGDCTGTVTSTVTGGAGIYNYVWDAGTALNSPNQNGLCAGTYNLEVSDINGCTQTGSYTIVEPDLLESNITLPDEICENTCEGVIDLTATGGTMPFSFNWNGPNGSFYDTEDLSGLCAGDYDVEVQDANGCISINTTSITTFGPVADFSVDNLMGCPPVVTEMEDLSTTDRGNIVQWEWSFGDGSNSSLQFPDHIYLVSGGYQVGLTVTTDEGCINQIEKDILVDIYPKPSAEFSYLPEEPTILDSELNFNNLSIDAVSWRWFFGLNIDSSSARNPVYDFEEVGLYKVGLIVESALGCIDTIIKEVEVKDVYRLYAPNAFTPDDDGINDDFRVKGIGFDQYELLIYDRWGILVFTSNDINNSWNGRFQNTGEEVKIDTYVWKISTKDFKGAHHENVGIVSVIR